MRKFYSQSENSIVTEEELFKEYQRDYDNGLIEKEITFEDFIIECNISNGGDLKEIK